MIFSNSKLRLYCNNSKRGLVTFFIWPESHPFLVKYTFLQKGHYHKGFIKNLALLKYTHLDLWDADQADRADIKEKNPFDPHNPRPTREKNYRNYSDSYLGTHKQIEAMVA